jgi:hypothetical protein
MMWGGVLKAVELGNVLGVGARISFTKQHCTKFACFSRQ